eukprot:m.29595 g.29595  ORF g.29595 m.29595 type:complete len:67 (+) comp9184_c0_seq1:1347-1547(+)
MVALFVSTITVTPCDTKKARTCTQTRSRRKSKLIQGRREGYCDVQGTSELGCTSVFVRVVRADKSL